MKMFNRHTLMLVVGIVVSFVGTLISGVMMQVWGMFGLVTMTVILPFIIMVGLSLTLMPKDWVKELLSNREDDDSPVGDSELEYSLAVIIGNSAIASMLGYGLMYTIMLSSGGMVTYEGFTSTIILTATYLIPYTYLLGNTGVKFRTEAERGIIFYLYIATLFTSVMGISLVSSFYGRARIAGVIVLLVSILLSGRLMKEYGAKEELADKKELTKDGDLA